MAKVYPYVSEMKRYFYCSKGHDHAQQPLNIICLDSICRSNPLSCSTCLATEHKYHKTVPLNVFLSDYQASIKKNNISQTQKRIGKQYQNIKQNVQQFKRKIISKLDIYLEQIDQYFVFLQKNLHIRNEISKTLNFQLDPEKLINKSGQSQLNQSLIFIIQNSLFNQQNRIINVSSILKFDEPRNLALLDKVANLNIKFQKQIEKSFEKLNFVKQTIGKEILSIQQRIKYFNNNLQLTMTNHKQFVKNENLKQTLQLNKNKLLEFQCNKSDLLNTLFTMSRQDQSFKVNEDPIFQFHERKKHQMLSIMDISDKKSILRSNITALKPQFGIICPSVDYQPLKQQNWSIKINNCRNFASKNTLAIGLCPLQYIQKNNYEQHNSNEDFKGYLVTSQGYMIKNGRQQKTKFRFSSGDTVHIKYDPYYKLLIVYKDNENKLTIKLGEDYDAKTLSKGQQQKLYGCVRLTYASDQVQILNHTLQEK